MKKLLKGKLGLKPAKIKSSGQNHAFLCFRTDAEKEEALQKLDGYKWKGNVFKAKVNNGLANRTNYLERMPT